MDIQLTDSSFTPTKNGVAIVIPQGDFSSNNLGQVSFQYGFDDNESIMNYGKAVVLPSNFDFSDNNLGQVTFSDKIPLTKISIWVFPDYLNEETGQYEIVGRGTVLYPKFYPDTEYYKYVKWSVVSGGDYVRLKTLSTKNYFKTESDGSGELVKLYDCCYVEIKEGVKNEQVVIECYSTDDTYNMIRTLQRLIVTYDNTIESEELGFVEIVNNTDTRYDEVDDTEITLTAKFYPQNTKYKNCHLHHSYLNEYYNDENLSIYESKIPTDTQDSSYTEATDNYGRYECKYNIWNDLCIDVDYTNKYYDEEEKTTTSKWTFKIPRNIYKLTFNTLFYIDDKLSFYDFYILNSIKFDFKYSNPLVQSTRNSIDLTKYLGYLKISENDVIGWYADFSKACYRYLSDNIAIGLKIITNGIYTPYLYVLDNLGTDNVLVCDIMYNKVDVTIYPFESIYTKDDAHIVLYIECKVVYDFNSKKFYMVYKDKFYEWSSTYKEITDETKIYHLGNIYSVVVNEDGTFDLTLEYERDNSLGLRIHSYQQEISYCADSHEFKSEDVVYGAYEDRKKYVMWSHTIDDMYRNTNQNTLGINKNYMYFLHNIYNWSIYNISKYYNATDDDYTTFKINCEGFGDKTDYKNPPTSDESNNIIYLNYSARYGEYIDISQYKTSFLLQTALDNEKISCNKINNKLNNIIIYTKSSSISRYTYYKDLPNSNDSDISSKRSIAEIDIVVNEKGELVNIGWGDEIKWAKKTD